MRKMLLTIVAIATLSGPQLALADAVQPVRHEARVRAVPAEPAFDGRKFFEEQSNRGN